MLRRRQRKLRPGPLVQSLWSERGGEVGQWGADASGKSVMQEHMPWEGTVVEDS